MDGAGPTESIGVTLSCARCGLYCAADWLLEHRSETLLELLRNPAFLVYAQLERYASPFLQNTVLIFSRSMAETLDDPVKLYMTHPLTSDDLERLLSSSISSPVRFEAQPYDQAHENLSPLQLFQRVDDLISSGHSHFVITDARTHSELSQADAKLTVIVAGIWNTSPEYEWDLYRGLIDIENLPEARRLALLKQLAEARAVAEANESGAEEWAWESSSDQRGLEAKLWQIKVLRADLKGMAYACSVYDVKDIRDTHRAVSDFPVHLSTWWAIGLMLLRFSSRNKQIGTEAYSPPPLDATWFHICTVRSFSPTRAECR